MRSTAELQQLSASSGGLVGARLLQRKCACGTHTTGGGECEECSKKKLGLQRKLAIGSVDDPLEREADRVADRVMSTPVHSPFGMAPTRIQRASASSAGSTETAPASVERVLSSPGRSLEPVLRHDMERRFGYDFSHVRTHSGSTAQQSARDVNAVAYTVGHNIVFGPGQFSPATTAGRRLLAHELTHVIQQSAASKMRFGQKDGVELPLSAPEKGASRAAFVQRACGESNIRDVVRGRTTHVELGDPHVKGTLVRFRVGCDEFLTAADLATLRGLSGLPKRTRIIIHGFASEEGPPMFNFLLSQARAEKVKDILSTVLDPAQIERVVMHGSVPGPRPDRRSVIIETNAPLPIVTKTLNIISWINGAGLPSFSKTALALDPPTIRVLDAACMALKCTANTAPPARLPSSALPAFLGSKQFRGFQSYVISHIPSSSTVGTFTATQKVGFTAPSSCPDVPPSTFRLGEVSPLNFAAPNMRGKDPKADALMKFRVSSAEESAAIRQATSFPASILFSASMLRHVPWVWTKTNLRIDASSEMLHWSVQGSAFPTHTIYLDGVRVDEIPQGPCGVVVSSRFRTADKPRQTMAEEARQAGVPISAQDETVAPGGTVSGTG